MLVAPFGSLKTFAALHLVLPIAVERQVVYIAGEGGRGVRDRAKVWREVHNPERLDFKVVTNMPLAYDPANADDMRAATGIFNGLAWSCIRIAGAVGVWWLAAHMSLVLAWVERP